MASVTRNIVDVRPDVIIRNEIKSLTESEMVSKLENKNLIDTRILTENKILTETRNLLDVETLNKVLTETRTESLTETKTETVTETVSKIRTKTASRTPATIVMTPFVPITPFIKRPDVPDLRFGGQDEVSSFDVFVRESSPKGESEVQEVKVNKSPLPRNRALNLGDDYVDNTSARTFRLVPAGTTDEVDDPGFLDAYKYRRKQSNNPKIKIESFIEQNQFLIDSPGEHQEITVKGWKAMRNKQARSGGL
jgi:hypothetical protein